MIIIFIVSIAASFYGTLIGGASLITIPTLMLIGLPPHMAIGTDRFGVVGLGMAGFFEFRRKGMLHYGVSLAIGIPAFFGAFLGANLVLSVEENTLRIIVALINLGGLILVLSRPQIGTMAGRAPSVKRYVLGAFLSFWVGVYGGFYGAMAGTFMAYIAILCFGQTFMDTAASIKIATILTTSMAAVVFAAHGQVDYRLGLTMFGGCVIGSYLGAHYSDRIGNVWIKRLFMSFLVIVVIKMLYNAVF